MAASLSPPARKKVPWIKLGAALLVCGVAGLLVLRGLDLKGYFFAGMAMIQRAGPVVFFAAMALLPSLGMPILSFNLTAGPAFGEQLGRPLTVALALLAVTFNFTLTYFLARRALRPFLHRWLTRAGYRIPVVEGGDAVSLVAILRLTPGVPFFAQNYLSGLAEVPVGKYLLTSILIAWPSNAAFVVFGDALLHGQGKLALGAVSALVVIAAVTHLARRHLQRRRAA